MEIGIYGLGRFGYFWAKLLSGYGKVKAYTRTDSRQTPEGVERVSEETLLKLPVIIICTAISAFEDVIRRIAGRLAPSTLVMDTCSVKIHPVRVMEEYLPKDVNIIATHPMFGPDSAKNGVKGLPLIFCPVRVPRDTTEKWVRFYLDLGLDVKKMTPREHDFEAAFTQGITHYVGRVLADLELKPSDISTLGYNKLLDIIDQTCNDPWQLFLDLQRYNPFTKSMREKLHLSLDKIFDELETSLDIPMEDNYHKPPRGKHG